MLDTPILVKSPEQLIAYMHFEIPREEIQVVMGPGLHELRRTVAAQEIEVVAPWFTHHLRMSPAFFDFEICLPIASPVEPTRRVRAGRLAAANVARSIYQGPYEGLGAAWGELMSWIAANGLKARADLWERYLAGPESSPDPATFRMELNRPLEI
jgi:effector-binding domain-containing protein